MGGNPLFWALNSKLVCWCFTPKIILKKKRVFGMLSIKKDNLCKFLTQNIQNPIWSKIKIISAKKKCEDLTFLSQMWTYDPIFLWRCYCVSIYNFFLKHKMMVDEITLLNGFVKKRPERRVLKWWKQQYIVRQVMIKELCKTFTCDPAWNDLQWMDPSLE